MKTLIWAHRGASAYAPENTMEAFQLAFDMGADGIELDVHLTKDGHLVVAHDETIDRCSNGSGAIVDMTLEELLTYDFSSRKPGYQNVRIPTLRQVLAFVKRTGMSLNVEIKSGKVIYEGIEAKLVSLIHEMELQHQVIYSSFNHFSLMLVRKCDPQSPIGLLYTEAMVDAHIYALHLKANAIHPYYQTLMVPGIIEGCHQNAIEINAWTVDKPEHLHWLFQAGIHAVITNCPDVAISIRKSVQNV